MRIKRIELEGDAVTLTIERAPGSPTVRVDSTIRDPKRGQQAWKTWELPATASNQKDITKFFELAVEVQQRTDGCTGTNSMVHDYYEQLLRFAD